LPKIKENIHKLKNVKRQQIFKIELRVS